MKSELFSQLNIKMASEKFTLLSSRDCFQRRTDGVTASFQLVCLDSKPGYRIQPNVGIRIERVEKIFHQTSGFESKFQNFTATMGNSIGMFIDGDNRSCEFFLKSNSDIVPAADNIARVFRDFALPYYSRWGALAAIDSELNNKPGERTLHRPLPWFRCSTGIIVAKLLGRSDYDQLAAFYAEMMALDNNGFYLPRFQALLNSLGSIEPESDRTPK